MKTETQVRNIDTLKSLPLAKNSAVEKLLPRAESICDKLDADGHILRRGGYQQSTSNGATYLYITKNGDEEVRIAEWQTLASGYFRPISGIKFGELLDTLDAI